MDFILYFDLFSVISGRDSRTKMSGNSTSWRIFAGIDLKISYADMEIGNKEYCHLFFLRYHMVTQKM